VLDEVEYDGSSVTPPNPYEAPKAPLRLTRNRRTAWLVVGGAQLCLGLIVLWWMFAFGLRDDSSVGEIFFMWGSLFALLVLVVPGLVMLLWALRTSRAE
jgi:hypothetical protein